LGERTILNNESGRLIPRASHFHLSAFMHALLRMPILSRSNYTTHFWIIAYDQVVNFLNSLLYRVVSALKLAEIENVTPKRDYVETKEDQQALNQARTRRAVFNFKMANIPIGAELLYVNDENVKAKVVDNKLIELNGEVTSLSASAQKLLGYPYQVQGTVYWMYEGETLDERRRRLEAEE
jgi:PAS domain-containing protein